MVIILERQELSARALTEIMDLTRREVEFHLAHVQRSLKNRLRVMPARCRDCGYLFKKRTRLDAPGRCPACRGQRMDGQGDWLKFGI